MSHRATTRQQSRHRRGDRHRRNESIDRAIDRRVRALRSAKGVAASNLRAGVIVLARVPYTDRDETKVRPAVVVDADRRHVQLRPITSSDAMTHRRGGGIEIVRHGRRCWVLNATVVVELIDVIALEMDHLDDYGVAEDDFAMVVTPIELTRQMGMATLTAGVRS